MATPPLANSSPLTLRTGGGTEKKHLKLFLLKNRAKSACFAGVIQSSWTIAIAGLRVVKDLAKAQVLAAPPQLIIQPFKARR